MLCKQLTVSSVYLVLQFDILFINLLFSKIFFNTKTLTVQTKMKVKLDIKSLLAIGTITGYQFV